MDKITMLDKLIELEDQFEKEFQNSVQEKVYHKMDELYGGEGIRICNIYYSKQDNDAVEEECDNCEKKAQSLLESLKKSTAIVDSLTGEETQEIISKIGNSFNFIIDEFIKDFSNKLIDLGIYTNDILMRNIITRLFIDHFSNQNEEK